MRIKPCSAFYAFEKRNLTGFTLVEMLVVMVIIAILTAASVAAFRSVGGALGLSAAGQLVTGEIATARQTAVTSDETVEVRFYYYGDAITGTSQYQAVQTFSSADGIHFTQLDRISYFPVNIMIGAAPGTSSTALSYPLGESNATVSPMTTPTAATGAVSIPGPVGLDYAYKVLRFKPDGSVDYIMPTSGAPSGWPPTAWFVTLLEKKYALAANGAIKNFVTVNVDSADGRVRVFQP